MGLSGIAKTVSAVEEVVRPVAKEVVQQIRPPMPPEDVRMLYGMDGVGQVPSDDKIKNSMEFHGMIDSQKLASARQEHAAILGNNTQTPQPAGGLHTAVLNPFSNKQTDEVSGEQIRTAVQDIRSSAKDLGVASTDSEKQKRIQKARLEEQEEERKKAEEQQHLETQVVAPAGKETGISLGFRRKSNPRRGTPRATTKLRSAELTVGQGVGG